MRLPRRCAWLTRSALLLATLLVFAGCSDWDPFRPPPMPEFYTIRVDSLRHTPDVAVGDTLVVEFWGYIGPSTCYEFFGFNAARDSFSLDVTVIGVIPHDSHVCGPALQFLRGEELAVFPLHEGDLVLTIHQPDESALVETVHVSDRALRGARPN